MDRAFNLAIKILELQEKLGRSATIDEILNAVKERDAFLDLETMWLERNLMTLLDLGILDPDWVKVDGKWYRAYYICDNSIEVIRKVRDKHE